MPTILVTGVSSGIGKATAEWFARAGWNVIGTYLGPPAEEVPGEWPGEVTLKTLNLSDLNGVRSLAREVLDESGPPDVLLNNAGILMYGAIEDTEIDRMKRLFDINVFGHLELTRMFLPAMRERRSGVIVNVTALGGRLVFPFFGPHDASKHAMEGFSEGLWHELLPFGIRVKTVEPGYVKTAFYEKGMKSRGHYLEGSEPYRRYQMAMTRFSESVKNQSSAQEAAEAIWKAVNDPSDRLRYPVASSAKRILRARRWFGDMRVMRFMHRRWMGKGSTRASVDDSQPVSRSRDAA